MKEKKNTNVDRFDWRTLKAIPPIVIQADCAGSLGAYTAAAAGAANLFIDAKEKGAFNLLSIQRLLDCRVPQYSCGMTYYDTDGYNMLI
jgi:hypothetical protein